jgi:hypothetical protein
LPSADIIADYRDVCRKNDEVLAVTPLSAAPRGLQFHPDPEYYRCHHAETDDHVSRIN